MSENFQFLEIIFFAMVAVFILLRLRGILGRRTGNEQTSETKFTKKVDENISLDNNVVNINDINHHPNENEILADDIIFELSKLDPKFDKKHFLDGAKVAYDLILTSFASGDLETLRALLDDDVYDNFQKTISDREFNNEILETTLVAINDLDIVDCTVKNNFAEITVCFKSETINIIRDQEDNIISGDPKISESVIDYWTFSRNIKSDNLNWVIIETRTEN